MLIDRAAEIDWDWLAGVRTVAVSAGASAPEKLIEGVLEALSARYTLTVTNVETATEAIEFKLPRVLVD